jgi:hypothetical protein
MIHIPSFSPSVFSLTANALNIVNLDAIKTMRPACYIPVLHDESKPQKGHSS